LEDEYSISFYQVDTKNEVFLPVLWSFMQETACIMPITWAWVIPIDGATIFLGIVPFVVRMEEYPRWGDRIKVKTWLTGTGRLFALRQFSMADSMGKILGPRGAPG